MTHSIQPLCAAIKKIIWQLKPPANGFSFLLLIGKEGQGKKTLLRQSRMQHVAVAGDMQNNIYYNEHGLIIELGDAQLYQNKTQLQQALKQLNRCHQAIKITGVILCVDVHDLLLNEPDALSDAMKTHGDLIKRVGETLGYRTDAAIFITKMDALAGFCEFYQQEHANDLDQPFGFSLNESQSKEQNTSDFKQQFDLFIESINQHTLTKIHPARSSIKRTLIREFPLQMTSLGLALNRLVDTIPAKLFFVQFLFFTSSEQSGFSQDRLNNKIQQEYALTLQDKYPLSNNYRAYFIQGALLTFQAQTKQHGLNTQTFPIKWVAALASVSLLALGALVIHHVKSAQILDKASQEWLAYDSLSRNHHQEVSALNHLVNASSSLEQLGNFIPHNSVKHLKAKLKHDKTQHFHQVFLPNVVHEIEQVITDDQQSNGERYNALKVYLMLGNSDHYRPDFISNWFQQRWQHQNTSNNIKKKLNLLQQALKQPLPASLISHQLVNDTRNLLNALPVSYLYYSLAKSYFPSTAKPIQLKGFILASHTIPYCYTKAGFQAIVPKLPEIAKQLADEQWVLNREQPANIAQLLEQAYSYDYALWWKNFIQKSTLMHTQNYQQAVHLAQVLRQSNAINQFITLIQEQTSPELNQKSTAFNQQIASQFTDLNLLNHSSVNQLTQNLIDLERFLTTISVVMDQGRTAFTITKSRFQGDTLSNPISLLFNQAEQLPEPVASWSRQLAGDTWSLLIADTKRYINTQWQQTVYQDYLATIANRYPFDAGQTEEVTLAHFNRFFSDQGELNSFVEHYIKPFLDTSAAQWRPKEINNYVLPISSDTLTEIMRANVITTMFFPNHADSTHIHFSLQKSDLDPDIVSFHLTLGNETINDTQDSNSFTQLQWPETPASLKITATDGKDYSLTERGVWAFFKLLQKVNVQADDQDSSKLQVLFEIGGNSGRYILKTQNDINPFTPGILNGFKLNESIA